MRIVLDVNVIISSLITKRDDSPPVKIVQSVLNGEITLCVSEPFLEELKRVLNRPKIRKLLVKTASEEVDLFIRMLSSFTYHPKHLPEVVISELRDPNDAYLLATAEVMNADAIITGDQDLLVLRQYKGIPICSPRTWVEMTG